MCSEHALCRLGGKHCTLKDSSLCLTEAEANKGLLGGNLYTLPACLLNHKVVRQALLCALCFFLYLLRACFVHPSLLPVQTITTLYRHLEPALYSVDILSLLCTVLVTITALDNKYKLSHKVPGRQGWLGCFAKFFALPNVFGPYRAVSLRLRLERPQVLGPYTTVVQRRPFEHLSRFQVRIVHCHNSNHQKSRPHHTVTEHRYLEYSKVMPTEKENLVAAIRGLTSEDVTGPEKSAALDFIRTVATDEQVSDWTSYDKAQLVSAVKAKGPTQGASPSGEASVGLYGPQALARIAAALGSLDARLIDLVKSAGQRDINPHVIDRCLKRFPQQCNLCLVGQDSKLAKSIYEETNQLPQTATEQDFRVEGYRINGSIGVSDSLVICFDRDAVPHVLKTLNNAEKDRITAIPVLQSEYIIKYSLRESNRGNPLMIMPLLPTTLEHLPDLSRLLSGKLWQHMKNALSCLHGHQLTHMDVKPSNICIDQAGNFILIDLGSVVRFGQKSASTLAYIPQDLSNYQVASAAVDWWMLAATLGERGCGMSSWGAGAANPTKEKLLPHVLKTLNNAEKDRITAIPVLQSEYIIKYSLRESNRGNPLMIMPLLPTTLEHLPDLSRLLSGKLWQHMKNALSCLHGHQLAHMDVKPSNICIDQAGNFILINLGSVVCFGQKSASTLAYIPQDLSNYQVASAAVDWWMLAATLGERGCGMSSWGAVAANPTKKKLRAEASSWWSGYTREDQNKNRKEFGFWPIQKAHLQTSSVYTAVLRHRYNLQQSSLHPSRLGKDLQRHQNLCLCLVLQFLDPSRQKIACLVSVSSCQFFLGKTEQDETKSTLVSVLSQQFSPESHENNIRKLRCRANDISHHIPPDVATTNLNTKRKPILNKSHDSMQVVAETRQWIYFSGMWFSAERVLDGDTMDLRMISQPGLRGYSRGDVNGRS
ncbi:protein kinase C delta type-like [Planoprotostelium fungivorum]|uniref:Protein kinase C delta type-like n=1 Tax=Planoprotostelium fungivorum TaxID=1890364 RepID=A0A2P6MPY2_9EUKA|nr:protein kinase C delta type-like [Planoprotostelium fungivorum]